MNTMKDIAHYLEYIQYTHFGSWLLAIFRWLVIIILIDYYYFYFYISGNSWYQTWEIFMTPNLFMWGLEHCFLFILLDNDEDHKHSDSFLFDFQSECEAAQTSTFAAVDKDLVDVTGKFFSDCRVRCMTSKKATEMH
jgi:hypothetical protein